MAKISLLERMIIEGRLNNVEKKFPLLATKHNGKSLIDRFSKEDPSGNNKYLAWMADTFFKILISPKSRPNLSGEELDEFVKKIYGENLPSLVGDQPYPTGLVKASDKIIQKVKE